MDESGIQAYEYCMDEDTETTGIRRLEENYDQEVTDRGPRMEKEILEGVWEDD